MQWAGINPYRGEGSGGAWGPGPRELSWPWGQSRFRGCAMVQKIIEVVGRSGESRRRAAVRQRDPREGARVSRRCSHAEDGVSDFQGDGRPAAQGIQGTAAAGGDGLPRGGRGARAEALSHGGRRPSEAAPSMRADHVGGRMVLRRARPGTAGSVRAGEGDSANSAGVDAEPKCGPQLVGVREVTREGSRPPPIRARSDQPKASPRMSSYEVVRDAVKAGPSPTQGRLHFAALLAREAGPGPDDFISMGGSASER